MKSRLHEGAVRYSFLLSVCVDMITEMFSGAPPLFLGSTFFFP